ncbi:MAG: SDR family NAD(P)-dependent oxidoreductase, partial [Ilumatobacteraceae bacterium]
AGIFRSAQLVKETVEQWDQIIAINQTGVFLGMRTVSRAMIAAEGGGSIVNISSVAGLTGVFGSISYSASKWAVRGMTKVAAKELGRYGIRVNSIHPGLIETPMTADFPAVVNEEKRRKNERLTPLGRLGTADDIASMALFLAGDGSSYCTGQEFVVDGGING